MITEWCSCVLNSVHFSTQNNFLCARETGRLGKPHSPVRALSRVYKLAVRSGTKGGSVEEKRRKDSFPRVPQTKRSVRYQNPSLRSGFDFRGAGPESRASGRLRDKIPHAFVVRFFKDPAAKNQGTPANRERTNVRGRGAST